MIKYMVSRPDGTRTNMLLFADAKSRVRNQAVDFAVEKDRRMRLKVRGEEEFGVWRADLPNTMDQWEVLVKNNKPGDVVMLDIEEYPYTITTRIIEDLPPTVQTEGNDDVDKIFTWLVRNKKGRNGGICNRRFIDGTNDWTQHSPWPKPDPGSNAVDWFSYPDTMVELYDQAYDLARAAKAHPNEVPVGLILVGDKAWTPEQGWHRSTAEYHRHLHIQGRRNRTGSPQNSC